MQQREDGCGEVLAESGRHSGLHGGVALWMVRSPSQCVPHTQLVLSIDLLVDGTSVMSSQVRNMLQVGYTVVQHR